MRRFVRLLLVCSSFVTCVANAAPQATNRPLLAPAISFVYPIVGTKISSEFGTRKHPVHKVIRHHSGIDLAAPRGAVIRAVAAGRVIFADPYAGYGNLVVVDHGKGFTTHYGHCDKIRVKPGDKLNAGAIIATVGSTGVTTGPHLHFEVRLNGVAQDPEKYLPGLADAAEG